MKRKMEDTFLDALETILATYLAIPIILVCTLVGLIMAGLCLNPVECIIGVCLIWFLIFK